MKIALVIEAAGAPASLASTAFAGALADGFGRLGVDIEVFGLAQDEALWIPAALGACAASAPWLSPPRPRWIDRVNAARAGIFDEFGDGEASCCDASDWYLELLFQRELKRFAGGSHDGVMIVYSRSYPLLVTVFRVAARLGWTLVVLSTEALSDAQIDPATRENYIDSVARGADGIWVVSRHLAEFWRGQGVPEERMLLRPGIVRPENLKGWNVAPRRHSAVYLGNLVHREIENLLDISDRVRQQVPDFTLTIFGDAAEGRRRELIAAIDERGLGKVVSVELPVTPVEVPEVLAQAEVLLLPRAQGEFSTAGFPNKLGEYLASGRPVVVTAVGDIPRYLSDGETAFIVAPDDCAAFAEAVVNALRDPELSNRVGEQGRRFADERLRSDRVAEQALGFLEGLQPTGCCRPLRQGPTLWWFRVRAGTPQPDPTVLKRLVVRVLRFLHMKPPAPESER